MSVLHEHVITSQVHGVQASKLVYTAAMRAQQG